MTALLGRLKTRLPDVTDDALLAELLAGAEAYILAVTGRRRLPPALDEAVLRAAAVMCGRMGMEGEETRTEGGVSRTVQALPEDIERMIRPYRLVGTMK